MEASCSPIIKFDDKLKTCLTYEALRRIAIKKNINYSGLSKDDLYNRIKYAMQGICNDNDDVCYLEKNFLHYEADLLFKPLKPKGRYTWLSNIDIEKIMKHQEIKYSPNFIFIGAVPADFDILFPEIIDINFPTDVKYIAMITNLDPHTKPGIHWTAFFLDIKNKSIEYFDSLNKPPFKQMKSFIVNLQNRYKFPIKINKKLWQKSKDGDCGIWSIWFILQRLKGISFEKVMMMKMNEKELNECRDAYFRN